MKDYKQVSDSVFRKAEERMAEEKRRALVLRRNIIIASGIAAVLIAGIGIWKNDDIRNALHRDPHSSDISIITETSATTEKPYITTASGETVTVTTSVSTEKTTAEDTSASKKTTKASKTTSKTTKTTTVTTTADSKTEKTTAHSNSDSTTKDQASHNTETTKKNDTTTHTTENARTNTRTTSVTTRTATKTTTTTRRTTTRTTRHTLTRTSSSSKPNAQQRTSPCHTSSRRKRGFPTGFRSYPRSTECSLTRTGRTYMSTCRSSAGSPKNTTAYR